MSADAIAQPAAADKVAPRRTRRSYGGVRAARGVAGILAFLALWQLGVAFHAPILARIPAPVDVAHAFATQLHDPRYYFDWLVSFRRVAAGFVLAQVLGIPLGLLMGWKTAFRYLVFPLFEVLRPIPPLAWVPLSIVFWPTTEGSIIFVIFLGAFFTTVISTLAGVRAIDERYVRAAVSLGANHATVFRRIIFPGALPSVFTGMAVGMGITWSVLVAAEIIAGRNGLGFLTWEAYVGGSYPTIIVGMISIGVAGYLASTAVRAIAQRAMPWERTR
jgi:NitT/TauT family transport system permease protein